MRNGTDQNIHPSPLRSHLWIHAILSGSRLRLRRVYCSLGTNGCACLHFSMFTRCLSMGQNNWRRKVYQLLAFLYDRLIFRCTGWFCIIGSASSSHLELAVDNISKAVIDGDILPWVTVSRCLKVAWWLSPMITLSTCIFSLIRLVAVGQEKDIPDPTCKFCHALCSNEAPLNWVIRHPRDRGNLVNSRTLPWNSFHLPSYPETSRRKDNRSKRGHW